MQRAKGREERNKEADFFQRPQFPNHAQLTLQQVRQPISINNFKLQQRITRRAEREAEAR
jgi:hypothetical protein